MREGMMGMCGEHWGGIHCVWGSKGNAWEAWVGMRGAWWGHGEHEASTDAHEGGMRGAWKVHGGGHGNA